MIETRIVVKTNKLPAISRRVRPAVNNEIHAAGFRIEAKAKVRARKDTGYMAASTANQPGDLSTTVIAPAEYSAFQNYGTRFVPGDSWFSGPVEEETSGLPGRIAEVVRGALG